MPFWIQINAYDPETAAAVDLNFCSFDDPDICHQNDTAWWPIIARLPTLGLDFFGGEFGRVVSPAATMSINIETLPNFCRYLFPDARIRIWHGESGSTWASGITLRFDGRVNAVSVDENEIAQISFGVDDKWLDQPLLATYAGSGGIEGLAEQKGLVKPLTLGAALGVPGVLLDSVKSITQLSAYGSVAGVDVPLERLARQFGSPVADYATYEQLAAATVAAGSWATAHAIGCVRMGAPPYGKLCFLMRGDDAGVGGYVRRAGAMIRRLADIAGRSAKLDNASLAALDVFAPYNLSLYLDSQTDLRSVVQSLAASVNAVAGVSLTGLLFATPIRFNAAALTADASGAALPMVAETANLGISAPWWRQAIGARPFWLVHGQGEYVTSQSPPSGPELAGAITAAATTATWDNVRDSDPNAPEDNATYGATLEQAGDILRSLAPNPNVFPLPRPLADGRPISQQGWMNAQNIQLWNYDNRFGGAVYILERVNGGSSITEFPYFDIATQPSAKMAFSLNGYGSNATFSPYVEELDSVGGIIDRSFMALNSESGRWEVTRNFTAAAAVARLVFRGEFQASGSYQAIVWWAIKAEYGGAVTPIAEDQRLIGGDRVSYANGQSVNALRPAQFGADVTGANIAAGFSGSGDLAYRNASSLPFGSNLAVNSDFSSGTVGWYSDALDFGLNLPNWHGLRNVFFAHHSGLASGAIVDVFYTDAAWSGRPLANAQRFGMPCVQNDRVFVRALLARHRCMSTLFLLVFDAAGNLVEGPGIDGGRPQGAGSGDPANFDDINGVFTIAHPQAAFAALMVRMTGTGEVEPYIFVTEPMIGKLAPGQTAIPPYTPGRTDPMADVTAQAQVSIVPPPPQMVFLDWVGNIKPASQTITMRAEVKRGGVDISRDNNVSYFVSNKNIDVTVNNIAGNPAKGTITALPNSSGSSFLSITIAGVIYGPYELQFIRLQDPPPTQSGGGAGGGSTIASDSTLAPVQLTTYQPITGTDENVFLIALSAGQRLVGSGNLDYITYDSQNQVIARWRYRAQGSATWLDLAGEAFGGFAETIYDPEFQFETQIPASVNVMQQRTGLPAGNYEMQLYGRAAALSAGIEFINGTATASAQN